MISPQERAIDMFNTGIAFIQRNTDTPRESIKSVSIDYCLNQIVRIRDALFYCKVIDDYHPYKSLDYWEKVAEVLKKL